MLHSLPRFSFRLPLAPRVTVWRDEAGFEEAKHPRANNGEFSKGSGGGGAPASAAPSASHAKIEAALKAGISLKGTSSERAKLRGMLKEATDPGHKLQLVHALKMSRELQKKKVAAAPPKEAAPTPTPAAPQATEAELAQARKTTPLQMGMFQNLPTAILVKFNEKYSGANTPKTTEGLNQKVGAFKTLVEQEKAAAKENMAAKQAAHESQKAAAEASKKSAEKNFHEMPHGEEKTAIAIKQMTPNQDDILVASVKAASKYGVKPGQMAAVRLYTASGYRAMNSQLRKGVMDPHVHEVVLAANAALAKMPKHVGIVTRGSNVNGDAAANYVPGMIIEERGFTSTTKKSVSGFGNVQFKIKSKTGVDVSDPAVTFHPGEEEVLFRSGSRFRVLKKEGSTIHMEEVDAPHHV